VQLPPQPAEAAPAAVTAKPNGTKAVKPAAVDMPTETAITRQAKKARTNDPADDGKPKTVSVQKTLGRNDPCWCGSGKKWKKCHYPQLG
jgi:uncharacterized protein YecA (UPF0149 family)